jgi:anti-sigma B factor antagonist
MSGREDSQPEWLPHLFDARVHLNRETVVVDVGGELCLATGPMLLERLEELEPGFARLVLDLRRVTFMDSTGIRLLVQLQSRAHSDGFEFLVSIEGAPARTLQLVGLEDQLQRVPGEEVERLLAEGSGAQDMARD